jgi:2-beta-glucuronyltransferase
MKRVVLVTAHYFESKRKAGFHWLAEAYWKAGCDVTFVTASLSWLSYFSRDHRLAYPVVKERLRLKPLRERLTSYVWFTPWHPAHLRSDRLNRLSTPFFRGYGDLAMPGLEPIIRQADLFVFESSLGLMLLDRFKHLNPSARYVYRVSDDLRLMRNHPILLEVEARCAPQFDLVSSPSASVHRHFAHLQQAVVQHHGINKDLLDVPTTSPYPPGTRNFVFVGNAYLDHRFFEIACAERPDYRFHVIGPIPGLEAGPNLFVYGELPFAETVPFLQHADAGLHTLAYSNGAEAFTDSLKVMQYTYLGLPIVAPEFLRSDRPHLFCYQPEDPASIRTALDGALQYDRSQVPRRSVRSWEELAQALYPDLNAVSTPSGS